MIEVYGWNTANSAKVLIMLEELGIAYALRPINLAAREQFRTEFTLISPASKTPAIIDRKEPGGKSRSVFDSSAILLYLAEKTGRLLPYSGSARLDVLQWLMFEAAGLGPACAQAHHFLRAAPEKLPYAIERYVKEVVRYYDALEVHLTGRDFLADEYSIADIAIFPWVFRHQWHQIELSRYPQISRWFEELNQRSAVKKGLLQSFD